MFQTQRAVENQSVRLWEDLSKSGVSIIYVGRVIPLFPKVAPKTVAVFGDALHCTGGLDRAVGQAKHLVTKPMKILMKPFR